MSEGPAIGQQAETGISASDSKSGGGSQFPPSGHLDEFSTAIGRGMRPTTAVEFDAETRAALNARLDEFDAVRERGAVEARTAWLTR